MRMRTCLNGLCAALFALTLIMLAPPATAQVQRIRGTIAGLDGLTLTVATREGPQVKITLAENYTGGGVQEDRPVGDRARHVHWRHRGADRGRRLAGGGGGAVSGIGPRQRRGPLRLGPRGR